MDVVDRICGKPSHTFLELECILYSVIYKKLKDTVYVQYLQSTVFGFIDIHFV